MNFSFYVAKRYLISGNRTTAINWITWLSSVGIVLGCMSLFVVLSVFSGLRDYSLSFANDLDPDYKILPRSGKTFETTQAQIKQLTDHPNVAAFSKTVEDRVVFNHQSKDFVAFIKGVDENFDSVNNITDYIELGGWLDVPSQEAVVGYGIADKLGLGIGQINQVFEAKAVKPGKESINLFANNFITESLSPVGLYYINDDANNQSVYTSLEVAQSLLSLNENQVYGIEIKATGKVKQAAFQKDLQAIFGEDVLLKNRSQLNETLLKMLNTENTMLYLIFVLVLSLVLFTLIGTLLMMIIDKKQDLITYTSFGYNLVQLKQIFWYLGFLISVLGGLLGIFIGFVIVWIQWQFEPIMINQLMPYPVKISVENFVIVLLTIAILGGLASWVASQKVSAKVLGKD